MSRRLNLRRTKRHAQLREASAARRAHEIEMRRVWESVVLFEVERGHNVKIGECYGPRPAWVDEEVCRRRAAKEKARRDKAAGVTSGRWGGTDREPFAPFRALANPSDPYWRN